MSYVCVSDYLGRGEINVVKCKPCPSGECNWM